MWLDRSFAGNVLALDLATTTGFAAGPLDGRPRYGSVTLHGREHVHRRMSLRKWRKEQETVHGYFTAVVIEGLIKHHSSEAAKLLAIQTVGDIELWAQDEQIPFLTVPAATARKKAIGRGTFPKGEAKDRAMDWCREQGFSPRTDDAGDALVLWHAVKFTSLGYPATAPMSLRGAA
jgi:hypothetical protein